MNLLGGQIITFYLLFFSSGWSKRMDIPTRLLRSPKILHSYSAAPVGQTEKGGKQLLAPPVLVTFVF